MLVVDGPFPLGTPRCGRLSSGVRFGKRLLASSPDDTVSGSGWIAAGTSWWQGGRFQDRRTRWWFGYAMEVASPRPPAVARGPSGREDREGSRRKDDRFMVHDADARCVFGLQLFVDCDQSMSIWIMLDWEVLAWESMAAPACVSML